MPGFHVVRSQVIPGEENRGGVAVLFKNAIWSQVYDVHKLKDQIWFRLAHLKDFRFGAVYIPPRDSLYYSNDSLALVHQMLNIDNIPAIMIGDFNARIKNLNIFTETEQELSYSENVDNGFNLNGKDLADLCIGRGLKPLNHMNYKNRRFDGKLTYRQRQSWISQVDWCFVSCQALDVVSDYTIIDDVRLPTDHAALAVELNVTPETAGELLLRASQLGSTTVPANKPARPPVKFQDLDIENFLQNIPLPDSLWSTTGDVNYMYEQLSSAVYSTAKESEILTRAPLNHNAAERWLNIVRSKDAKMLWNSINWKGDFDTPNDSLEQPTDDAFCTHYQNLLNPDNNRLLDYTPQHWKYVPILDDPITPGEVEDCLKTLKTNKAAGLDAIAPGLLKVLPDEWIVFLTYLFNCVFFGSYPDGWTNARFFNIFKKGPRMDPSNYRGISILVSVAKVYDMVLSQRFKLWHQPRLVQAGAQKKRGCSEQILILRLLIDIARKKKQTLYVLFIDYSKAYDKVDRNKLLEYLDNRGCGSQFLTAIKSSYKRTTAEIGNSTFTATAGVRQGACSSCPLFVFFIEPTIDSLHRLGADDWLGDLHALLLMDDTVLLATSRQQMAAKLAVLKQTADSIGMAINESKSQFMCVNSEDTQPFKVGDVTVNHTQSYTYLGTPVSIKPISEQVKDHLQMKNRHALKFFSFLQRNCDAPYLVKKTVWSSALKTALFYSCETWMTQDLRAAESVFNSTLKSLLGVRQTTCNDIVFVESGEFGAKSYVRDVQVSFIRKLMSSDHFIGSYIEKVINLAIQVRSPAGKVLQQLIHSDIDYVAHERSRIIIALSNEASTRRTSYRALNPNLSVHETYTTPEIPENHRIAFTRMRLSSHHLAYETGRWSRIPADSRTCPCGAVQSDLHVMLRCAYTNDTRRLLNIPNDCADLSELYRDIPCANICSLSKAVLDLQQYRPS